MVVHCGDVEGSEYLIREASGCPVQMVQGNNDFFSDLPRESEFTIGRYRVWLTHGHNYYIAMNNEIIKEEARARNVDIVMCQKKEQIFPAPFHFLFYKFNLSKTLQNEKAQQKLSKSILAKNIQPKNIQ